MSNDVKAMLQSTPETFEKIDAKGRLIKVRKPSALKRFRFIGMLGKQADSDRYMSMVGGLIYLYAIDDDTNISLNTLREMEALIQRLDDEGMETLTEVVNENFFSENAQEALQKEKDEIKE